ncbi:hypothetical protein TNCV_2533911 [Trichonephila clavipes]|nr:hypothetical protein TNCV_2533911 [Trichonephila clavipes]
MSSSLVRKKTRLQERPMHVKYDDSSNILTKLVNELGETKQLDANLSSVDAEENCRPMGSIAPTSLHCEDPPWSHPGHQD